mmetsp:Transcript_174068/g.552674  ORF Transcript_174068/g.552674 Transcript_174068/m.552674 type:complete len:295 (+) Transcript_174068:602-1486(+)
MRSPARRRPPAPARPATCGRRRSRRPRARCSARLQVPLRPTARRWALQDTPGDCRQPPPGPARRCHRSRPGNHVPAAGTRTSRRQQYSHQAYWPSPQSESPQSRSMEFNADTVASSMRTSHAAITAVLRSRPKLLDEAETVLLCISFDSAGRSTSTHRSACEQVTMPGQALAASLGALSKPSIAASPMPRPKGSNDNETPCMSSDVTSVPWAIATTVMPSEAKNRCVALQSTAISKGEVPPMLFSTTRTRRSSGMSACLKMRFKSTSAAAVAEPPSEAPGRCLSEGSSEAPNSP